MLDIRLFRKESNRRLQLPWTLDREVFYRLGFSQMNNFG
jgi:hypothetical protein